jgi:formylglycine-generating enzyme required for sulfatase activity
MSGNVWEWCYDWFGTAYPDENSNPTGPDTGTSHVIRGGSWGYDAMQCELSKRSNALPENGNINTGFRLVINANN